MQPLTSSEADVAAAQREDGTRNRWFLDPVLRGAYPEDVVELWQDDLPAIADGDLSAIARPLDFLGVNYYRRHIVRAGQSGAPIVVEPPGAEQTSMGWEVYPDGLHELLVSLHGNYELPPVLITENGAAFDDVRRNGTVRRSRADVLRRATRRRDRTCRRGRCPGRRLLPLVAARQFRVGAGFLEALRDRLRGLRDAGARPEGELRVVQGLHCGPAGDVKLARSHRSGSGRRPFPAASAARPLPAS